MLEILDRPIDGKALAMLERQRLPGPLLEQAVQLVLSDTR